MDVEAYLKIGQECGLQGKALFDFVESKEKAFKEEQRKQHELEREERLKEREERLKEREERGKKKVRT